MRLFNFFKSKCITEASATAINPEDTIPQKESLSQNETLFTNLKLPDRIPTCQPSEDSASEEENNKQIDIKLTLNAHLSKQYSFLFIPNEPDVVSELTDTEDYQKINDDETITITRQNPIDFSEFNYSGDDEEENASGLSAIII